MSWVDVKIRLPEERKLVSIKRKNTSASSYKLNPYIITIGYYQIKEFKLKGYKTLYKPVWYENHSTRLLKGVEFWTEI